MLCKKPDPHYYGRMVRKPCMLQDIVIFFLCIAFFFGRQRLLNFLAHRPLLTKGENVIGRKILADR